MEGRLIAGRHWVGLMRTGVPFANDTIATLLTLPKAKENETVLLFHSGIRCC